MSGAGARLSGPGYTSPSYGEVTYIDTSAILGEGLLHVFLTNRSQSETAPVSVEFGGKILALQSAEVLTGPGPQALNTYEQPNVVVSSPFSAVSIRDGQAAVHLPPLSVAALTFQVA